MYCAFFWLTSQSRFARTVWRGIEGHHGAGQVQRPEELGEVAGLVVLDIDLDVVQQPPAVLGGAEQMDPGAISAAGPAGRLAVHGHRS